METKLEKDLSPQQRELFKKARDAANSKQHDYAIQMLFGLIKQEPAFFQGRQMLRAMEMQKVKAQGGAKATASTQAAMKLLQLRKTPQEIMQQAEEALQIDPYNAKGNHVLAQAAMELGLGDVAVMAYSTVKEGKPDDTANLHLLAKTHLKLNRPDLAQEVYEQILLVNPHDGEALTGVKNASAAATSKQGGWETAKDFRDMIKDKNVSSQLEQQNKVVKSEEAIDEQIALVYAKHQAEPTNVLYPKQIGALAAQKNDFDNALAWYNYAFDLTNKADSALERIISDLSMKKIAGQLAALEAAAASDPEAAKQLEELKQQRDLQILDSARQRVQKYPNDNQFRFELGEAYFNSKMYKEALPELQLGAKQPNVRLRALNLIGSCYKQRGMLDLAIKTFSSAIDEIPVMDETKKMLVYNLAEAYEATKQNEKAIEQYKLIYEVDMGYRDVAEKVEASYNIQ